MENMTYFKAGELVEIKQNLDYKPVMVVKTIKKARFKEKYKKETKNLLLGVACFWFTPAGEYCEQIFSTKDLSHVRK